MFSSAKSAPDRYADISRLPRDGQHRSAKRPLHCEGGIAAMADLARLAAVSARAADAAIAAVSAISGVPG